MDYPVTVRSSCRVCGASPLTPLYSLGNLFVSGFVAKNESSVQAPLEMVLCGHCSLVQLKHTAPQELLYARHYWYKSGVTRTMREALAEIAQALEKRAPLQAGDVVLDIGSNDGTLLRAFSVPGLVTVGVEPAKNLAEEGSKGLAHFIGEFWSIGAYQKTRLKKAKVISAIGMFYDMEDPNQFVADAAAALDENGLFVAQLMCLKNMLDTNDLGNICHEHLEYYSLASLEFLFRKNGLRFLDIEHNRVNGGSYRIYACLEHSSRQSTAEEAARIRQFKAQEEGLGQAKTHFDFFARIEENKRRCVTFIKEQVASGKRIWVYGASTKGNTILQVYGLDHRWIEGASERSAEKWGKFTVGTHIPIYSEEEARRRKPDFFLVMPYAFLSEFYEREKAWRDAGGKFLVPLPEFKVVETIEG